MIMCIQNFVSNLSICSKDIEQKLNSDINKGRYSVTTFKKMMLYNSNVDLASENVLLKFA